MVVSDSPHLAAIHNSETLQGSRCSPDVMCTNSFACRDAAAMVLMSPCCSMEKLAVGLPVAAMPSAISRVQSGSMPMTTQAATFGFDPVPIMVRK